MGKYGFVSLDESMQGGGFSLYMSTLVMSSLPESVIKSKNHQSYPESCAFLVFSSVFFPSWRGLIENRKTDREKLIAGFYERCRSFRLGFWAEMRNLKLEERRGKKYVSGVKERGDMMDSTLRS